MGTTRNRNAASGTEKRDGGNSSDTGKGQSEIESAENGTGTGTENGTGAGAETANGAPAPAAPAASTGKARAGNNETIKPADLTPDNIERDSNGDPILGVNGKPKKKRGRKPGQQYGVSPSGTKSGGEKTRSQNRGASIGVEMLAAQFQILNTGIAYLTKFDDFKLDDEEAMSMASATANVMEQFDYVPDPKIAAVLGLVTTTSMIYGPRVYLYRKELRKRTQARQEAQRNTADENASFAANGGFGNPEIRPPLNNGQFNG